MGGINKNRYPIRSNLGRYQRWYLTLYGKKAFRKNIRSLELFFDAHPNRKFLTQFSEEDVDEWAIQRKTAGYSEQRITRELTEIRKFWRWAIEHKNMEVMDVLARVKARWRAKNPPKVRRNRKTLNSIEELRVILQHCSTLAAEQINLYLMGPPPDYTKCPRVLQRPFPRAAKFPGYIYAGRA